MAYKITLRFGGGMLDLSVTAKPAVEKEDKDTKLVTICCGSDVIDLATGKDTKHPAAAPKQKVTCPICLAEKTSFHGWEKGRDNDDGTFTPVPEDVLTAARPGDELTKSIDLVLHPLDEVEDQCLPSGRVYYLEPGKDGAQKYNAAVGAVHANLARGRVYCVRYAVVSSVATYRLIVLGKVLAFQELATPEQKRATPAVDFPEAQEQHVQLLLMASDLTYAPFNAANYADDHRRIVAEALARATSDDPAGATPVVAAPRAVADPFAALAALLAGGDKVPLQALPPEVPANVSTALLVEKPPAKKRAPRKPKEKMSA